MLALQLVFPSLGQAGGTSSWIEICSEFGVIEIEVAIEDGASGSEECPDCNICLMCASENGQAFKQSTPASGPAPERDLPSQLHSLPVASNPAQFWHDGRGPPRLNSFDMARACGASMATTQSRGEASWI